jgi:hypothetical protein
MKIIAGITPPVPSVPSRCFWRLEDCAERKYSISSTMTVVYLQLTLRVEALVCRARRVRQCMGSSVLYATLCIHDTPVVAHLFRPQPYRITGTWNAHGCDWRRTALRSRVSSTRLPSSTSHCATLHNEAEFHGPHVIAHERPASQHEAKEEKKKRKKDRGSQPSSCKVPRCRKCDVL